MYFIEQPLPAAPAANSKAQVLLQRNVVYDAYNEVACLILSSMTPELHKQFENSSPYDMIKDLKSMFEKKAGVERPTGTSWLYATTGSYSRSSVNSLTKILQIVVKFTIWHEHGRQMVNSMLCSSSIEKGVPKKGKANGKEKDKQLYIPKPKNPKPSAKKHPAKDDTYHHYKERYTDFGISVSKNIVFYFNVIPSNGIYEIDMHDLVPNVNSIYNVSTKRAKHNLDSTYLWHCRLGHISKKRIEKLQQEGLLKSTDDESFDQCVPCLSGKMTRKLFPHRPERATDLLGIIHTNVCGPLRHVSRQDRGGEYISQEFKDYLKACRIVQQLTPPYTPQNNRDYALESATRILNMVPTKKVDKTLYELWYGKVPNLSYIKSGM
ncbi:retrotransposon protein, putative, ty1-copia subclass [Tanacetum coccineum]